MKKTILMSLYYKEDPIFLDECLKSLLNQVKMTDEVIVVLDGGIPQELEKVLDSYLNFLPITLVRLENNVGLGKALNEGIKHCSNEWVFRMDTDDICLPDRFEKQVTFIQEHPDIALLGGQITEFDEDATNTTGERTVPITNEQICQEAIKKNPFNHMTVAYKKSAILDAGGYQHHLFMEDYNLWLRVIAKGYKVANLSDVLVNVRAGDAMYRRRKGLDYIKSEWQLAKLKTELGIQSLFMSIIYFFMRAIPRLLPTSLLGMVYKKLRD